MKITTSNLQAFSVLFSRRLGISADSPREIKIVCRLVLLTEKIRLRFCAEKMHDIAIDSMDSKWAAMFAATFQAVLQTELRWMPDDFDIPNGSTRFLEYAEQVLEELQNPQLVRETLKAVRVLRLQHVHA